MVKLSDRLKRMADEVRPGDRVADIGTDHGLLPIFLYENHIASHLILCDIKKGPLEKARENIRLYGAEEITDLRQGDGLTPLRPGEADTVIIAGMGGLLIARILETSPKQARSCGRLVLQPRNAPEKLRERLAANDYQIERESLVREGKFICEIITASPSERCAPTGNQENPLRYEISDLLFESRDKLLVPFIEKKITVEHDIAAQIREKSGKSDHGRLKLAEERISVLNELLEKARKLT